MRLSGVVPRLALMALAAAGLLAAGIALAGTSTVMLTPTGPQPQTVTVNWGDTVAFVNGDSVQQGIQSTLPAIGTTTIAPGATVSYVFTTAAGIQRYVASRNKKGFYGPAVDVTVNGTVKLAAQSPYVTVGHTVALFGTTTLAPGLPVAILARPLNQYLNGTGKWIAVAASVSPDSAGSFAYTASPAANTEYLAAAAAGQLLSDPVKVLVTPIVAFHIPRTVHVGKPYSIHVTAQPRNSLSGATLEIADGKAKTWRTLLRGRAKHGDVTLGGSFPAVGRYRLRLQFSVGTQGLAPPPASKPFVILVR